MYRRTLIALVFALSSAVLHAQVVGGTISGTVSDPSGALIPNAVVVVHNQDTGTQRTLTTNNSGAYSAPSIPVATIPVRMNATTDSLCVIAPIASPSSPAITG